MPFLGELSALLTAMLWAGSAMIFASATKKVGSFQVNITRLILAVIYLTLLIIILKLDINLSKGQIINLSISGIIGLAIGDTFLFKAFQEIGARISMLIMSLAPAIAALLAFLVLGETLSAIGIIGIAITIIGVSIVLLERGANPSESIVVTTSGIVFALFGAVGQGVGLIFAKMAFIESEINGFVATDVRIMSSLVLLLPFAMMTKRYKNPFQMFIENKKAFQLTALGSILGPFLGISFSLIAIKYTNVGIAATIMAIVPILMLPLVRIVYKEKLSWRSIIGAFIAVGGVALLFLR